MHLFKTNHLPTFQLPAGAVSMFGNAPNPLAAALKQKLGGDNSEDEVCGLPLGTSIIGGPC